MDASSCLAVGALQAALTVHVPAAMAQLALDFERRSMQAEDLRIQWQMDNERWTYFGAREVNIEGEVIEALATGDPRTTALLEAARWQQELTHAENAEG